MAPPPKSPAAMPTEVGPQSAKQPEELSPCDAVVAFMKASEAVVRQQKGTERTKSLEQVKQQFAPRMKGAPEKAIKAAEDWVKEGTKFWDQSRGDGSVQSSSTEEHCPGRLWKVTRRSWFQVIPADLSRAVEIDDFHTMMPFGMVSRGTFSDDRTIARNAVPSQPCIAEDLPRWQNWGLITAERGGGTCYRYLSLPSIGC